MAARNPGQPVRDLTSNYPAHHIGGPVNGEAIKRQAFTDMGVLVVQLDDPRLAPVDREILRGIGKKLFGKAA